MDNSDHLRELTLSEDDFSIWLMKDCYFLSGNQFEIVKSFPRLKFVAPEWSQFMDPKHFVVSVSLFIIVHLTGKTLSDIFPVKLYHEPETEPHKKVINYSRT